MYGGLTFFGKDDTLQLYMVILSTITNRWQLTITKSMRKILGIKHPGRVILVVDPKQKLIAIRQSS